MNPTDCRATGNPPSAISLTNIHAQVEPWERPLLALGLREIIRLCHFEQILNFYLFFWKLVAHKDTSNGVSLPKAEGKQL